MNRLESTDFGDIPQVPTQRGKHIGRGVGQNLSDNFPGYDEFIDGVGIQLYTCEADTLEGIVQGTVNKLRDMGRKTGEKLSGKRYDGSPMEISPPNVKVKALVVGIKETKLNVKNLGQLYNEMSRLRKAARNNKINIVRFARIKGWR